MPAKAEGIAEGVLHFAFFRTINAEVPFGKLRVLSHEVDGGMNDVVLEFEDGGDAFDSGAGTHEVAGHRLGGIEFDFFRMSAEQVLNSAALSAVAQRCGGAMCVDVFHIFWGGASFMQGELHG